MRSLPVKLVLTAAVALTAFLAVPSVASAHFLNARQARQAANRGCQQINENQNTPYVCRGIIASQRRSAHVVLYALDVYDPNDGEECTAIARVYIRTGSRRIRGTIQQGDCQARPTTS